MQVITSFLSVDKEGIIMQRINVSSMLMAALVVIGLSISTLPAAAADTTGVWKLTGNMATSRQNFNRELLPDGRILVVGGTNTTGVDGSASVFYNTAEIYDPATGTWTATGSLTTGGRALFTSVRLPDGKILITGGWNGTAALATAEIYNPATGTWTATGSMRTARAQHQAQVLFDGRVLITGGFDSSGNPLASAEIYTYNTQTGTGSFARTTGSMGSPRYGHRMNNVGADNVLVTGGFGAGGVALASSELFNPASGGSFTSPVSASLAHARGYHGTTTLPTGEILVSGGLGGGAALNSTELYNPDTGTFTDGAPLTQARRNHSAVVLPNGLVLISGGNTSSSTDWDIQTNFLSSSELYDRMTNTFTPTGSKNNATSGATGFLLWTGKFLSAGGGTNKAELYNPLMPGAIETWVAPAGTTPNLPAARTSHQQTLLDDGRVLLTGGLPDSTGASTPLITAVLYDYLTDSFTPTGDMRTARQQHRTALLYTGEVLVTGGRATAGSGVLNSAELYDPVSGTFTFTGNMLQARRNHRATELRNGKVLITGGQGSGGALQSIAELYDPATGIFTQTTGGLITARRGHQAALLYTGKVLIAGGAINTSTPPGITNLAELYNPATNTFTATTNTMITARNTPNLNRLPNGKVLVSGGSDAAGTPIRSLEIFDPATGTFTAAGDAPLARDGNRTFRMDNGETLSVGGQTTAVSTSVTDTADLYNYVTASFAVTDNLIIGRQDFSLTGLPNGRILVAGGIDAAGNALTSAELYTPLIGDLVDTTITSGPPASTTSTDATFSFTSDPGGGTFTCSLDYAPFIACTTGQPYSSLTEGSHNFQVHATVAGNTDPTPANHNWTVLDTTPPNTVIDGCPTTPTTSTSAHFVFHSTETGGSFQCQLDSGGFSTCSSPKDYAGLALGPHTFEVKATDGAGNTDATPASCSWTIITAPLAIGPSKLPNGEVGVAYNTPLVSGGAAPYSITITKGALPAGLTFNTANGSLTGTPDPSKGGSFTAEITDATIAKVTGAFKIKLLAAVNITTTTLKAGTSGKAYKGALKVKGGAKPYNWTEVTSNLAAAGLTLNPATGAIGGSVASPMVINFTVQVTDSVGGTDQQALSLTIN